MAEPPRPDAGMKIEIVVQGLLPKYREQWFEGMSIQEGALGSTLLVGRLPDQAALYGLLDKLRDLGLNLISVKRMQE